MENGFSLLFGSYYFQNNKFYKKSKTSYSQLNEQILRDGGHFELSLCTADNIKQVNGLYFFDSK